MNILRRFKDRDVKLLSFTVILSLLLAYYLPRNIMDFLGSWFTILAVGAFILIAYGIIFRNKRFSI